MGNGVQKIVVWHGHGQQVDDFQFLHNEHTTVYLFHLFHHSHSHYPTSRSIWNPMGAAEFQSLLDAFIQKEVLDNFHLLAYSQGCRFALHLFYNHPEKCKSLTLMAPDGIDQKNYFVKSATKWYNILFMHWLEKHPKLFLATIQLLHRQGKLPKAMVEMAKEFSSSPVSMRRASRSWIDFRKLLLPPDKIGQLVQKHAVPFIFIMGKFDHIFPPKIAHQYLQEANIPGEVVEINCGHYFFEPHQLEMLKPHLPI